LFDPIPNNALSRADLNNDCGLVRNVHYGDILIRYGAVVNPQEDTVPFITGANVSDYAAQLLCDGDILISDAAEDETVGKSVELQGITDTPVVSGLHTIACRPNERLAPKYLGYYMNSPAYHGQLRPIMQGTKVLSLSRTALAKTTVSYPAARKEQEQLGALFAHFDHLITLHQREPCECAWARGWSAQPRERSHYQINVLVLKLVDDVQIGLLGCRHTCVPKSSGHARSGYPCKEQK